MKTFFAIFLFAMQVCYAQIIPHTVTIVASKDSVLADEVFTVTYSLKCPAGYVYVGIQEGYFETIGMDRWEGEIKDDETKTIMFTIKLKASTKAGRNGLYPLSIGYSYKPFGETIIDWGEIESIVMKIINYSELKHRSPQKIKSNKINAANSIDQLEINLNGQKTIYNSQDTTKHEYYSNLNHYALISRGDSYFSNLEISKNDVRNTVSESSNISKFDTKSVNLQFNAASISFRNTSYTKLPWQYYTVEIRGKETADAQDYTVLQQQKIASSSTGGFTISTTADYPYYQLVLLLVGDNYIYLWPNDDWNGSLPVEGLNMPTYGVFFNSVPNPGAGGSVSYSVTDPDINSTDGEIYKVLNICADMITQGFNFVKNKTTDTPGKCLIFFNQANTVIGGSYEKIYTMDGIDYPGIYIKFDRWNEKQTVLHEYGHAIQSFFSTMPPESGGAHALGIRYNPQLAYSEGWGHFFAAAVTGSAGVNPNFNLSSNPPYSVSYGHYYTPSIQFEGSCDEVMVASLLWEMYTSTSNNYGYMHSAMKTTLVTGHKPYNIFEFIKNHKVDYEPGNGAGYWTRASNYLKIGSGIYFVNDGGSIQNAVASASNKNIVYVSQGTYQADISISSKDIALFGEAPKNTIIASPNGRTTSTVNINNAGLNYTMLNGFTISGGNIGVDIALNSKAYVSNNIIESNNNGVSTKNEIILKNNVIRANATDGFFIPLQSTSSNYNIRAFNNVFDNNQNAIHFYNSQGNMSGDVRNNIITNTTTGFISANSSITDPIFFGYNAFYNNTNANLSNVISDGGDLQANPSYVQYFTPNNSDFWDAGFNPPTPNSAKYEFMDRSPETLKEGNTFNANMIGLYGGPEGFNIKSKSLPSSIPTGIEDYLWVYDSYPNPNDPFIVNQVYYGRMQKNFVDVDPIPGDPDYIVQWGSWKVKALSTCGEILIYDSQSSSSYINIPPLPGYSWIRDANGNVKAKVSTSGTDNDGYFHESYADILIGNVPNTFITSGALTSNTLWCGDITITGTITVPSGLTLTVNPGANISFPSGASLLVYGQLNAMGCTFTSTGSTNPGSWGTITFNGTGASNSNLNYAVIKNGSGIQCINGANITIQNSVIQNLTQGIYVNQSVAAVTNCEVTGCSNHGIYLYGTDYASSQTEIKNCKLYANVGGSGIAMWYSSPLLIGNEIYNNYIGVGVSNLSQPNFGMLGNYGNNNIHDNASQGIYAMYYGSPFLGRDACEIDGGRNILENNLYHDLLVTSNVAVLAENNWWGTTSPNTTRITSTYNTIDYDPWLYSPPFQQYANMRLSPEENLFNKKFADKETDSKHNIKKSEGTTAADVSLIAEKYNDRSIVKGNYDLDINIKTISVTLDSTLPLINKLGYAKRQIDLKHYKVAQLIAKEMIEKYPDSSASFFALGLLWRASKENDLDSYKLFLNNLSLKKTKNELYGVAEIIEASFNKKNRIAKLNGIINKYKDTKIAEFGYYDLFLYYLLGEENEVKAKETGELIITLFPNSIAAIEVNNLLNNKSNGAIAKSISSKKISSVTSELPTEYKLLGNYPNPFNPSTTISYALPLESNVEINIFDIMGRLIRTFELNGQSAGYQNVLWTGRNDNNEQVASGIYLYRFKAVATNGKVFEKTSKLLMLK